MAELVRRGHSVSILTSDANHLVQPPVFDGHCFREDISGVRIHWLKTLKYFGVKSVRRILSWLHFEWRLITMRKVELDVPDVVVVSSLSLLTVLTGVWWKWRYRSALIFEVRDIWPLTLTEEGGFSPLNPLVIALGLVEKIGYRCSDAVVGTMPNLVDHVRSVSGSSRPVFCIPMGLDSGALLDPPELPDGYAEKNIPTDKFIVAHVGSIGATNALDTFFEAAEALWGNSYIHLLLVGDGDLRAAYEARYGHLQNVTFAPKVAKSHVPAVLENCDLLYFSVHASKVWDYGQSLNKVIDYMSAGKPILASYGGFPSMINEAGCGEFVPPSDAAALVAAIKRFCDLTGDERNEVGARGRKWLLENRRYPLLAEQYEAIMRRLIEQ
ncbi:glycosyltransferase [Rhodobacterales bacterium LSUCC0246]|nr:glycosyltransferase [Rhodobacterales bacterium LSUCC0374]